MKKRICTKPFEWFEIFNQPQGGVYVCCPGWLPQTVGNIYENDALSIWRGKKASRLRASMLDGSFRYCDQSLCPYIADPDAPESPMIEVDEEQLETYKLAVMQPELFLPAPKVLNAAYDRSCNLACPSCRSEILQVKAAERDAYGHMINGVLDVFADQLETLYVTGSGDPFGSRHFWELLTGDITERFPKLRYRLHTNAILFTEQRWEKLKHLHERIEFIEISIDGGAKESYEYNRFPAKWDVLLERMDFIATIRNAHPHITLKINHVVQANNWRDLPNLIRLADQWHVDIVKISKINNWGTYSEQEFKTIAVHHPMHPDYRAFINLIQDPMFAKDNIILDSFGEDRELLIASDWA